MDELDDTDELAFTAEFFYTKAAPVMLGIYAVAAAAAIWAGYALSSPRPLPTPQPPVVERTIDDVLGK